MDMVRIEDVIALSQRRDGPCISIFMSTERAGVETLQGPIRFKNRLREAEQQLGEYGEAGTSRKLLRPLRELVDDYQFWQHQSDGLAVYLAPSLLRLFRIPISLQDLVVVANRFHIKPVLSMVTEEEHFFVLALSQKQVRLLRCTRFTQDEVELPAEIPAALTEVSPDTPEAQLHAYSAGVGAQGGPIFHGNPAGAEESKTRLLVRFQRLDRSLREVLGAERAPLVLASVGYLLPIFREASTYVNLCSEGVSGNPDEIRNEDLREMAWRVAEPEVTARRTRAIDGFRAALPAERASGDLEQVVIASAAGRVDSLLVAVGVQKWGRFDMANRRVELHDDAAPGDEDLIDLAAILTLERSGSVFAVAPDYMPDHLPVAAVFRY